MQSTKKNTWDYTQQAKYYSLRPNYAPAAIDKLIAYVNAQHSSEYIVADIGAGTGNLTLMLLERGLNCKAVEPTDAMREIGMQRTQGMNVEWTVGTGEATGLKNISVNWFTMGSSFNTTDRVLTLKEAHRVLKPGGYFTCMWNHRDVENDPLQQRIEKIIRTVVPNYNPGVRREGQADVILESKLFNNVYYLEEAQTVTKPVEEYIEAWKSVKNPFWDITTVEGKRIFDTISDKILAECKTTGSLSTRYITRIWTAQRV